MSLKNKNVILKIQKKPNENRKYNKNENIIRIIKESKKQKKMDN